MEETLTIDEAAAYVGMGRRNFERLKLGHQEEFREAKDGKKRKVRVYKKTVLDEVKGKREQVTQKPALVMSTTEDNSAQVVTRSDFQELFRIIASGLETNSKLLIEAKSYQKIQSELATFRDKLLLNFAQAVALSGLTESELKRAMRDKKVLSKKTSKNGRWKIHRESLEKYCEEYFKAKK